MNCPNGIRKCPHGWEDCSLCANKQRCDDGTYEPVEELQEPELEVDLGIVIEDVVEEKVEGPRMTWFEKSVTMTEDERWAERAKYPIPNLHTITDPYKAEMGAFVPGGGGKCRVPKKPQRKVPEYMKILGM